jgi:hypothetical protein
MSNLFNASRLYEVLAAQGLLPQTAKQNSPETGDPSYYSAFNKMYTGRNEVKSDVAHEMTHAVQSNILQAAAKSLSEKKNKTAEEKQFLEAYQKLLVGKEGLGAYKIDDKLKTLASAYSKTAEALYGKPVESRYDRYRVSPREAQAHGVGHMSIPGRPFTGDKPHMDASYTTEFDILLSMYDKLSPAVKKEATTKRKEDIAFTSKWFGEQNKGLERTSEFTDIFSDPFAPTIK